VIGVIQKYDPETQSGLISNGKELFKFDSSVWIAGAQPEEGDHVKFDLSGDNPFNINLYAATLDKGEAVKRKIVALLLALFLGLVGAHRFYLGYYRIGIIQIIVNALLWVAGLPGYAFLWGFVETVLILGGHLDKDAQGRPLK
jgi:TM2 domain-containing membrane protein YozV